MDAKIKTALISTGLNTLLSLMKFVLYGMTGSLAILAEAWHSVSDIGTSIVVLLSVRRGSSGEKTEEPTVLSESDATLKGYPAIVQFFKRTSAEHYAAFGIGIFLTLIGSSLILAVYRWQKSPIQQPLVSGLLFLLFGLASFFVYKYETSVGRITGSVGLVSDGLHSKADMIGSLFAGGSLILYSLGIDIDRPVAFIISLCVLSFAVETLVVTVVSRIHGNTWYPGLSKTISMILLLDQERLKKDLHWVEEALGVNLLDRMKSGFRIVRILRRFALAGMLLFYASTMLYEVGPTQQAIVERFGRPIHAEQPVLPGLHAKLPWPIDRVIKEDTYLVRRRTTGNIATDKSFALLWTNMHGVEEPFLTGDNNFFLPYLVVHYRIGNLGHYLIHCANPDELLDSLTMSIASQSFASRSFAAIVGTERAELERLLQDKVQSELNELKSGIEIIGIHFRDMHPPAFIADSFESVVAAQQEKARLINQAYSYRNAKVPEARGKSVRSMMEAEAYVTNKCTRAEGETDRFVSQLLSDTTTRDVTKSRLYLDVMTDTLKDTDSILIDPKSGAPTMLLDNVAMPLLEKGRGD